MESGDHAKGGAQQAKHGSHGTDVAEVGDACEKQAGLPVAFSFGDFLHFFEARRRIASGKVERLGRDPGDAFVAAIADGEEAEVVLLADQCIGRVHEGIADDGALPDGEGKEQDHAERHHRQADEGVRHDPGLLNEPLQS